MYVFVSRESGEQDSEQIYDEVDKAVRVEVVRVDVREFNYDQPQLSGV